MNVNKKKMPAIFIGHGSPMNAIQSNEYTKMLSSLGKKIGKPQAILCISAHWMTNDTQITYNQAPKTVHDFYGFPKELFEVQYPAKADLSLADKIMAKIPIIKSDIKDWGYDHGSWAVLKHMYPKADVPVLQLSINMQQSAEFHFKLGEKIRDFRDQGILILGSGNIVHNLKLINWETSSPVYDWAQEFDDWIKMKLEKKDFTSIVNEAVKTNAGRLSIPTWEHFYPLLYVLGACYQDEKVNFEFEEIHHSSISMRSLSFGL